MAQQNIYDNDTFFEGYRKLRGNEGSANNLFEIPALFSLLPDLTGKKVLDLGCGFGEHCIEYVNRGASEVVGLDISEKMLEVAGEENSDPRITYLRLPMEELDKVEGQFDIVISSLAFHYVEDFSGVVGMINEKLCDGGFFIFSQENPLTSTHGQGPRWTRDEAGNKIYVNLSNYGVEGERETTWFVDNLKKYHRMFSTIVNTLVDNGFSVERMIEPIPDDKILEKYPDQRDLFHKPDFLIVKAIKRKQSKTC